MTSTPGTTQNLHPNRVSPEHVTTLGITAMLSFLAIVSVALRFVSRKITAQYWWDDWAAVVALAFALGFLVTTTLLATVGGAGYHINTYSREQLTFYLKTTLAHNILYNASITLSKASVLLLYVRLFSVNRRLLVWAKIMGFLLFGYFFAAAGGLLFAYQPVEAQWDFWLPHTEINSPAFWVSMASINISLDLTLLAIPQSRVWRLQMSRKRQFLLSLVFLLGGFVIIASIIRIVYLLTIDITDVTYTFAVPALWTLIEMDLSVICACLPVLPGLLRRWKRKSFDGQPDGGGARKSRDAQSATYLNLEGPSYQGFQTSIGTTSVPESYGMEGLGPVHVKREFIIG